MFRDAVEPYLSGFHGRASARPRVYHRVDIARVAVHVCGFPCKCACHPAASLQASTVVVALVPLRFIVTLFTPICRFMTVPLGRTGPPSTAGVRWLGCRVNRWRISRWETLVLCHALRYELVDEILHWLPLWPRIHREPGNEIPNEVPEL
jgi:hypothetical protein